MVSNSRKLTDTSDSRAAFKLQFTNRLIRYQARLAARPLLTQAVTTSILFAIGDVAAQQLVDKKGLEKHDLTRTGRMALYGGGTSAQRLLASCHVWLLTTTLFSRHTSRLRPRRRDLVQAALAARQPAVAQRDDPGARGVRPGHLRADLHRRLPQQHGRAGGHLPAGEARTQLLGRAAYQLDDLAVRADGQLQARAAAAPPALRQRHQHRVELLPELFEQLVRAEELLVVGREKWPRGGHFPGIGFLRP